MEVLFYKNYVDGFNQSGNIITLLKTCLFKRFACHHGHDLGVTSSHSDLGHNTVGLDVSNLAAQPIAYSCFQNNHLRIYDYNSLY